MAGPDGTQRDPYDMPRDPTIVDLLTILERRIKLDIRTNVPATVVAFTPAPVPGVPPVATGGNASVTVLVGTLPIVRVKNPLKLPKQLTSLNTARGEATLKPITLQGIPVEYPGGAQGGITWPIQPGDTGMLSVCDRSIERWKEAGAPKDPILAATHALEFSVFRPGLRSAINAIAAVDMTATVVDGTALVKVGAGAADFVALAAKVLAELTAIKTAFDLHTHPVPGVTTGVGATTSSVPSNPLPTPGSVAATKAMAE